MIRRMAEILTSLLGVRTMMKKRTSCEFLPMFAACFEPGDGDVSLLERGQSAPATLGKDETGDEKRGKRSEDRKCGLNRMQSLLLTEITKLVLPFSLFIFARFLVSLERETGSKQIQSRPSSRRTYIVQSQD